MEYAMFAPWKNYLDSLRLAADAQQVILMRMADLAKADPASVLEAQRMVGEKVLAFWATQSALGWTMLRGPQAAIAKAAMPYKRAVRANRSRLTRARRRR
jgi:hypothetical protein